MKRFLVLLAALVFVLWIGVNEGVIDKPELPGFLNFSTERKPKTVEVGNIRVLDEESVIINAIDKALPSVVTISIKRTTRTPGRIEINPFDPFSFRQTPGEDRTIERNIGSGFAIRNDLIITNKHVVGDPDATYTIITNDEKEIAVTKISKDPLNDLAILQVDTDDLQPIVLGDSENLKLGQIVIAIGTPLGEFTNTVTSGIISGLGRGITAGSPYEGFVERLDNVIQTDAAINPGNSGGPLLNSLGEVIGVNTAVSAESENIGFAIPVNIVKDLVDHYDESAGQISRPFIGVRYQMISKESAILNEVPEGAYVVEVVEDSPADRGGIEPGDIITRLNGEKISGEDTRTLQNIIAEKNVGDTVDVTYWRDGDSRNVSLRLTPIE